MSISVAGLLLRCISCSVRTYFCPPFNTEEIREGNDVCRACAQTAGLRQ